MQAKKQTTKFRVGKLDADIAICQVVVNMQHRVTIACHITATTFNPSHLQCISMLHSVSTICMICMDHA